MDKFTIYLPVVNLKTVGNWLKEKDVNLCQDSTAICSLRNDKKGLITGGRAH